MDFRFFIQTILIAAALCLAVGGEFTEAASGCPFEDTSCREYCATQGCNLGYCGHFAWVQCICRKCGEWNSYDKARSNETGQVNQTEPINELNLNGTRVVNGTSTKELEQQNVPVTGTDEAQVEDEVVDTMENLNSSSQENTVTLLLVPDLSSDNDNLDQNEIPDENSEKFLDYLVDNHAKLVQATLARASQTSASASASSPEAGSQPDDDLIEIQLSSNSNSSKSAIVEAPNGTTSSPLRNLLRPEATKADATTRSKAN